MVSDLPIFAFRPSALPQDMLCNSLFLGARPSWPLPEQARRLRSQADTQELLWRCPRVYLATVCVLAAIIGFFNGMATAQETPGQIEKRFEAPVLPKSTREPLELQAPEKLPPVEVENIRFVLTGVAVQGSTVYKESDLRPLYERYLNTEISLADVFRLRDAITAKYGNDGYILSRAIVPPQRITDGIVALEIIEGFR